MTVWDEADEFCPHCDNHFVSHDLQRYLRGPARARPLVRERDGLR